VSAAPRRQTSRWVELVFGESPRLDDLAEAYHEASKVSPLQIGRQVEGARRLEASPDLRISSTRSVKRRGGRVARLPEPHVPELALWEAIRSRRSRRAFSAEPLDERELSTLLHGSYGVTGALEPPTPSLELRLRAVPSGGALYPLELYVAALRVNGLQPGLYHFDPLRPGVEIVEQDVTAERVAALSTYPEIVGACAVLVLIAAIFGRTRFKYGLRGYRFALLEAGHVAQNVALIATALGLAAVPLGGFYDRPTDEFLGLDGVNESTLYAIAVGREAR
jgi:SagB-type dehydrogenase family enzyme